MRNLTQYFALSFLLWLSCPALAVDTGELIMTRSSQPFPETMSSLQAAIKHQGYTLSKVQRVDIGLTARGFKTDKYRVVFFGKADEIHYLSRKYPELIPYIPLKIAIFAEADETLLTTANPMVLADLFPDPALKPIFTRWHKDMKKIINSVQNTE
ncbi:MAG: DUF302 domain-containing protein [Gammaproteobacteria bacterium]|nr:DUF302 domain-containing protein [Gammaproteobacteria bacterium]